MDFLTLPTVLIAGLLVRPVLTACLNLLVHRRRDKYKRRLLLKSYPPERLLSVADSVQPEISVRFQDRAVKELSKCRYSLHNIGREPITASDVVSPVTLRTNRPILSVATQSEPSRVNVAFEPGGQSIIVRWELFNQGCVAVFDVTYDSHGDPLKTSLDYQIAGIRTIQEETVSRHETPRADEPILMEIADVVFGYVVFPSFVIYSFWFWFGSRTNNPENLEEFHLLSDITWFGMWLGAIVVFAMIVSGLTWFYREFIKKD